MIRSPNGMVGVPAALHSKNHNTFHDSIFKCLHRNFLSSAFIQKLVLHNLKRRIRNMRDQTSHPPINVICVNVDLTLVLMLRIFSRSLIAMCHSTFLPARSCSFRSCYLLRPRHFWISFLSMISVVLVLWWGTKEQMKSTRLTLMRAITILSHR